MLFKDVLDVPFQAVIIESTPRSGISSATNFEVPLDAVDDGWTATSFNSHLKRFIFFM